MNLNRKLRKALIEIAATAVIALVGLLTENPGEFGIGAGGVFVLLQARRAIRDALQGSPE